MENSWEKACKEFLKGCSCSELNNQEGCKECLKAFCNQLRFLADIEKYLEKNMYCIKRIK